MSKGKITKQELSKEFADEFNSIDQHLAESDGNLETHNAETVQQSGGVHGLEVEEGVFTPVFLFDGVVDDSEYARQYGRYNRVGNHVHVEAHLQLSFKGNGTGAVGIGGLPFASNISLPANIGSLQYQNANIVSASFRLYPTLQLWANSNTLNLILVNLDGGTNGQLQSTDTTSNAFQVIASIDYSI